MFASKLLYHEHLLFLEGINATDTDRSELPVLLFLNGLHKSTVEHCLYNLHFLSCNQSCFISKEISKLIFFLNFLNISDFTNFLIGTLVSDIITGCLGFNWLLVHNSIGNWSSMQSV